ncbi:MAG TPA: protease-like activity factor CPAF [Waddliaceae bacterium]
MVNMLNKFICLTSVVSLLTTGCIFAEKAESRRATSNADQYIKSKMVSDLEIIKNTFQVKYAPAEWKKVYADWDLNQQIGLAKCKIQMVKNITLKDFHQILVKLFNSTKDYHVGITFFSTEAALLPFRIHSVNGRYFIAWAFQEYCEVVGASLKPGDEILSFNGKTIGQAVQELKDSDFGNPESATDQAYAESALTIRVGSSGNIVPKGVATISIRDSLSGEILFYKLPWLYQPEEINTLSSHLKPKSSPLEEDYLTSKQSLSTHPFFYKDMTTPLYKNYKLALKKQNQALKKFIKIQNEDESESNEGDDDEDTEDCFIGSTKSFIPTLGPVLWETSKHNPFHAYIFLSSEGKKIGYIRIPNYLAIAMDDFLEIINLFEEETDALVVDQVNNPGGNLLYMYGLAAVLADKPLLVPQHRMTLTQEELFFAITTLEEFERIQTDEEAIDLLGKDLAGYPVNYQTAKSILSYLKFIIQEWNEGRAFTYPGFIYGIDYIHPHSRGHYTKPILLLINQLDFSCADFLPAIMQDNKRATLFGTRTAGAGGYVLTHHHPNLFAIQGYSFTGSIAERINLDPIENLGVTPDIVVELTERDLQEGYSDYLQHLQKAVNELSNKH